MNRDDDCDDRLMERTASGDTAAFDRIVRRYQHRLQRFATRMMGGDETRGADVAVGTMLRLWESRHSYHPCGLLGPWLLKTAHRLCLDILAQNRPVFPFDDEMTMETGRPESCVENAYLAKAVRDAVMELPEPHRAVLILSVYEEMSYGEIAAALDISSGTVASRKNHAIGMLRRRLAAWETR